MATVVLKLENDNYYNLLSLPWLVSEKSKNESEMDGVQESGWRAEGVRL